MVTDTELMSFMRAYESANNSHDIDRVVPHIAEDATYWFTDGSYRGINAIRAAIERTFTAIQDETYEIEDLEWIAQGDDVAVCRYRFAWAGEVNGVRKSGAGRGTNVIVKRDGAWRILHEHLSA